MLWVRVVGPGWQQRGGPMRVYRKVKGSHDESLKGLEEVLPCPRHTFQPCPRHKVGPSTACSLSPSPLWRALVPLLTCVCCLPSPTLCSGQVCILLHTASQSKSRSWKGRREASWKAGPGSFPHWSQDPPGSTKGEAFVFLSVYSSCFVCLF